MSEQNESPVINVSASDSAALTDASTLSTPEPQALTAEDVERLADMAQQWVNMSAHLSRDFVSQEIHARDYLFIARVREIAEHMKQEPASDAPEPLEIARRYRWERIERAVKVLLEHSVKTSEREFLSVWIDLQIAFNSPPAPPPDEPRLTRAELIALTEAAEKYLPFTMRSGVTTERYLHTAAAIVHARELIGRGEDRIKPERFTPKD